MGTKRPSLGRIVWVRNVHGYETTGKPENDYPDYGQVDEIIVWEDEIFFILTELETLCFHNHFVAYEVERSDNKAVVLYHDLPWHGVLHVVQKNGKKFIVE